MNLGRARAIGTLVVSVFILAGLSTGTAAGRTQPNAGDAETPVATLASAAAAPPAASPATATPTTPTPAPSTPRYHRLLELVAPPGVLDGSVAAPSAASGTPPCAAPGTPSGTAPDASDAPASPLLPIYCFDPSRPIAPEIMAAVNRAVLAQRGDRYASGARWIGPEGAPITLTWSLVPDGTIVPSSPGNTAPSNLFAAMDAKFAGPGQGGRAAWISQIQASFNRWATITGTTYTRVRFAGNEWDDGQLFPQANAQAGVRGDIRIAGCNVDGAGGGVLAFAFLPQNGGDMVLDTSEDFGNSANNFRFFRNTVMHEHGHTLGMPHVCSSNSNQLMEPFLDLTIDGPQHDDIRSGHRLYGDEYEPNDSLETATDFEVVPIGQTLTIGQIPSAPSDNTLTSISVPGDVDLFKFTISTPTRISIEVAPAGFSYDDNEQDLGNLSCGTGRTTNSRNQADLTITVLDSSGAVLLSQNLDPIGLFESTRAPVNLGVNGVYYVGVSAAGAVPQTQNYLLRINAATGCTSPTASPPTQSLCQGGTASFTVANRGTGTVRWRRNGVVIPNSNLTTFTINSVTVANQGTYDCLVDTSCGQLVTNSVTLSVTPGLPTITTQPISQTVCTGTISTFSIAASNVIGYQWRRGGANISGATGPTLTTATAGNYDCVVSNVCGSATSSVAALTLLPTLRVTQFPSSRTVCAGQSTSFFYGVTGTALTYQWLLNNIPIPGATSATYAIPSASLADAGTYLCSVNSPCGNSLSLPATLTVNAAPSITAQPAAQTVCAGQTVSFSTSATGTPALSYQWRRDGSNIPGATGPTFSTTVSTESAGAYTCFISNACGNTTTASVDLTVRTTPDITAQPTPQTACDGAPAAFSVTASGGALTYQWRFNGANIPGATASTYSIAAISQTNVGSYDCVVTNPCSSTNSSAATLSLNAAPTITVQPSPQSVCTDSPASFSVSATGTGPITYQWRFNGTNIPGATGASYLIPSPSPANVGAYDCLVTNACGSAASDPVSLTVDPLPSITAQPASTSICPNALAPFSVSAADTSTYQWQVENAAVPGTWIDIADGQALAACGFRVEAGAALATLQISATTNAAGQYCFARFRCVASNACGSVSTNPATLTICPADFDCSGGVTVQDIFDFFAAYFAADPRADFNAVNGITVQDIFDFLAAYFAGC